MIHGAGRSVHGARLLLDLVHLLDDMLAHEQDARPTMADAHASLGRCLVDLTS